MENEFKAPVHVDLEVESLIQAILGDVKTLKKDLQEDERICTACKGLGICKWGSPYGLDGDDPKKGYFPYTQEHFGPCNACYNGVQTFCKHCLGFLPKGRTLCNCDAAQKVVRAAEAIKEAKRQEGCERIAYADYKVPCMYDDDAETFIYDDGDDLDHTHTYFACTPTTNWVGFDKDDVLDRIKERACEEVEEGDDMVDWAPEAEEKLEALLSTWFKENVTVREAYWPDRNTIVVVTPKDCGITWDENGDELPEEATT